MEQSPKDDTNSGGGRRRGAGVPIHDNLLAIFNFSLCSPASIQLSLWYYEVWKARYTEGGGRGRERKRDREGREERREKGIGVAERRKKE